MPRSDSRTGWTRPGRPSTRTLLIGLALMTLLLIWPTASSGQDVTAAAADSVLVPRSLLIDARDTIDEQDRIIAEQDSLLDAQRDYYIELLALKDQHIGTLQEIVEDAQGGGMEDVLEKLLWGLAGYGLHAAGD